LFGFLLIVRLKQATDELLRLRKEVTVYKQHEEELAVQWKQGETSNNHALRMVGTLQTESDRLRQESETSKRQLEEVKAAMVLKTEESERWMSERTILGNRQNDLRQEIRKLSIQLAAKTEECSKTKVDLLQLEGRKHNHDTHHKNHRHHNPAHGQTLEQQRDEVSQLMLARDQLQHDHDIVSRQLHVAVQEKDGLTQVREICIVVHVGGARCVPSSTDHFMKMHARIILVC